MTAPYCFGKMLRQGVFHQHQHEGIGLMLLQIPLSHMPEAADIPCWLGRERKVGIIIISVFGVNDVHMKGLLVCYGKSIAEPGGIVECARKSGCLSFCGGFSDHPS